MVMLVPPRPTKTGAVRVLATFSRRINAPLVASHAYTKPFVAAANKRGAASELSSSVSC